jgi:hypothetical protein
MKKEKNLRKLLKLRSKVLEEDKVFKILHCFLMTKRLNKKWELKRDKELYISMNSRKEKSLNGELNFNL